MGQGVRIWSADGRLEFDSSFAAAKVLGIGTYGAASGSLTEPKWAFGRPFWILNPYATGSTFFGAPRQTYDAGSKTLTWSNGQDGTIQIVWGIY